MTATAQATPPVTADASPTPTTPEVAAANAARPAPKAPEAQSTAVTEPIVPPETPLPKPKPVVNSVTAPANEVVSDPLASIVKEVELKAAAEIGDRIAALNKNGAQIDTTGLAVDVKITRSNTVAEATGHVCAPNCAHCTAQKEAAPEAATAPAAAPLAEQPVGESKPETLQAPATDPVTSVAAPAVHQGIAANKDTLAKSA